MLILIINARIPILKGIRFGKGSVSKHWPFSFRYDLIGSELNVAFLDQRERLADAVVNILV